MTRRALHSALVLLVFATSCSAQQHANEPQSKVESTAAPFGSRPGESMPYPSQTQLPSYALPAPGDLDANEAALDVDERTLMLALDPNSPVTLSEGDRCAIVCNALQSMRRSAEHICSLAQDRCEATRERVRKAAERAKDACPACATPT